MASDDTPEKIEEDQQLRRQLVQTQAALGEMGKVQGLLELLSKRNAQSPPETGPSR